MPPLANPSLAELRAWLIAYLPPESRLSAIKELLDQVEDLLRELAAETAAREQNGRENNILA